MAEIKAPVFPESVADGTIATWNKQQGDAVKRDDVIAEIETDKVVLEVIAPDDGVLSRVFKEEGDTVLSAEVIAELAVGDVVQHNTAANQQQHQTTTATNTNQQAHEAGSTAENTRKDQSPAVRKAAAQTGVNPNEVQGTGRGGRVTKADMANPQAKTSTNNASDFVEKQYADKVTEDASVTTESGTVLSQAIGERVEKRVPMTRLRKRIAERLLAATNDTAMLTTFNEVNMKPIMDMRKQYQERFEKRHDVRLGFMSFFVKAATEALKRFPAVNASLDGDDIVYHGYYDIGVAVSSDRGLVVPVLRDTDRMNLAEVEKNIIDYGSKAREGKLGLEDMTGGTFTISNGGVFGSLMSTPILNPPQTAILGMHKIQQRPMAVNGEVVILPMMYLALSYDHRMIDGKEAVQFLVTLKDLVEDPALLLLDL